MELARRDFEPRPSDTNQMLYQLSYASLNSDT